MKPYPILLLIIGAAEIAGAGFAAHGEPASKPGAADAVPPAVELAAVNNYRLSSKDVIHIKVFQEEDLETTARISKDGSIPFPLLGTAKIGGETVQEATSTMERLLREYLVKPQVFVTIIEYSKRRFTILGQVSKPGTIDMPDDSTVNLLEAIGMAGGYTRIAEPKNITVKRIVQGREVVIKLDAKKMLQDNSTPSFQVLPGDTILVGESLF